MTDQEKIEQARKEGKWLWIRYYNLWFSPDELLKEQSEGRFRWSNGDNFEIRDPQGLLDKLEAQKDEAQNEIESVNARILKQNTS